MTKRRALEIHYNLWTRIVNYIKDNRKKLETEAEERITLYDIKEHVLKEIKWMMTQHEYNTIYYEYTCCALCAFGKGKCGLCIELGLHDRGNVCLSGRYKDLGSYLSNGKYDEAIDKAREIANLYYVGKAKLEEMGEW